MIRYVCLFVRVLLDHLQLAIYLFFFAILLRIFLYNYTLDFYTCKSRSGFGGEAERQLQSVIFPISLFLPFVGCLVSLHRGTLLFIFVFPFNATVLFFSS